MKCRILEKRGGIGMLQTGLSVYRFSLKESRRERVINLVERFGANDFIDLLYYNFGSFCKEQRRQQEQRDQERETQMRAAIEAGIPCLSDEVDQTRKKVIEFDSVLDYGTMKQNQRDFYKFISFRIRYGEAGVRTDITNTLTGDIDFVQQPHHAPMRPFHVLLAMPVDDAAEHGLLIMQRIQREGLKSILPGKLNMFFRAQTPSCVFRAGAVASEEHVMQMLDSGAIDAVKLIKYYENDRSDSKSMYSTEEQRIFKRPAVDMVKEMARKCIRAGSVYGTGIVAIDSFVPDCVDVVVDVRGKKKTVSLTGIDAVDFTEYYTVSDGVRFDDGNLPITETLLPIMHSIVEDYISVLWK